MINFGTKNVDRPLLCPRCGGEYLHHECVTVFNRSEDNEETVVTEVSAAMTITKLQASNEARNPSSRRDGLAILFWCEYCPFRHELTIAQHKGRTFVDWRPVEGQSIDKLMAEFAGGDLAAAASAPEQAP